MTNVNIESVRPAVEILAMARAKMAELKKLEAAAKSEIEAAIGNQEIGEIDGEPVIRIERGKKKQFNKKAFDRDLPALSAQYTDLVESSRVLIIKED